MTKRFVPYLRSRGSRTGSGDETVRPDGTTSPARLAPDSQGTEAIVRCSEDSDGGLPTSLRSPAPDSQDAGAWPFSDWERYQCQGPLGAGGMGRVFRVWDPALQRQVALKVLHGESPERVERFLREAKAQARVDHPNVCKVFEAGVREGRPYIAMQLIEGMSLHRLGPEIGVEEKAELLRQVAEGLHAAHRLGLVHRDLKPGNIMVQVDEDGRLHPYVVDFGLVLLSEEEGLTQTGSALGTPSFMAPELVQGRHGPVDRRADVYALGATLFAVLAGVPPFMGTSAVDVLLKVAEQEAPLLRTCMPHAPRDLETIVQKCLEKAPDRRYTSARELAEDLGRFLDGEPILARSVSRLERTARWISHNPLPAGLGAAVLGVSLGAVGLVAWQGARARQQTLHLFRYSQTVAELEGDLISLRAMPPHDTADEVARLRARLEGLEREVSRAGSLAQGPAHAALGRGFLALGETSRARKHYERAVALGFRTPGTLVGYGLALSALYQQAAEELARMPKEDRRSRADEVEKELRLPALEMLRRGWDPAIDSRLLEANILAAEGQSGAALDRLRELTARRPWDPQPRRLECTLRIRRVLDRITEAGTEDLDQLAREASEALRIGRDLARSDPFFVLGEARLEMALLGRQVHHEVLDGGRVARLGGWIAQARALDHASDEADHLESEVHSWLILEMLNRGQDPSPRILEAVARCRRVLIAHPDLDWPLSHLVELEAYHAYHRATHGRDPSAEVQAAREFLARLRRLRPSEGRRSCTAMGIALMAMGDFERSSGRDPRPAWDEAFQRAEEGLSFAPRDVARINILGLVLDRLGDWEASRGGLSRAWSDRALLLHGHNLEREPENPGFLRNMAAAQLRRAGRDLESSGLDPTARIRQAVDLYGKVIRLVPSNSAQARSERVQALLVQLQWESGRRLGRTAPLEAEIEGELARLDPAERASSRLQLLLSRAWADLQAGEGRIRSDAWQPFLKDPGMEDMPLRLGRIRLLLAGQAKDPSARVRQLDQALAAIEDGLRRDPYRLDLLAERVRVHLARLPLEPSSATQAEAALREGESRWPGPAIWDLLGGHLDLLSERGPAAGAAERIRRAAVRNPSLERECDAALRRFGPSAGKV